MGLQLLETLSNLSMNSNRKLLELFRFKVDQAILDKDWIGLEFLLHSANDDLQGLSPQQLEYLKNQYHPAWWEPLKVRGIELHRRAPEYAEFVQDAFSDAAFRLQFSPSFLPQVDDRADLSERLHHEYLTPPFLSHNAHWVVLSRDEPVGFISLCGLDFTHKKAEFLVGFPRRDRSFSSVGSSLFLIDHAFNRLGLEKLFSLVRLDNELSQKSTESLGFRNEGILRGELLDQKSGQRHSLYRNGLLRSEFEASSRTQKLMERYKSN